MPKTKKILRAFFDINDGETIKKPTKQPTNSNDPIGLTENSNKYQNVNVFYDKRILIIELR